MNNISSLWDFETIIDIFLPISCPYRTSPERLSKAIGVIIIVRIMKKPTGKSR
jgi:hypothetical protein